MCKQAIELAIAVVAGKTLSATSFKDLSATSFYVIDAASKQEIGCRSLSHHGDLSRNANKNYIFF